MLKELTPVRTRAPDCFREGRFPQAAAIERCPVPYGSHRVSGCQAESEGLTECSSPFLELPIPPPADRENRPDQTRTSELSAARDATVSRRRTSPSSAASKLNAAWLPARPPALPAIAH